MQWGRDAAHLWDMLDASRAVVEFVKNTILEDYLKNDLLQAAVERKIEVIGEAARRVSDECKGAHPEIPWRRIVGQRNMLAHEYGSIDHRLIWNVIKLNIPELIAMLESIVPPLPDGDDL
jgi:uncharacterized protein with HEPN domain